MNENTVEKSFCTTSEAAAILGVSVATVQIWAESGLLRGWKTAGGHRRLMRDSVERLLKKQPDQPPQESTIPGRRLKILVVEDDPILLRLYETQIARWPLAIELLAINNAVEALLTMGVSRPDLIILDLFMAGMDGFGMLKVLSQTPMFSKTSIVVVTGLNQGEIDARGGIPQGVEILPKPIPFARLLEIATDLVSRA